jgi:hypothetical protein
VSFITSKPGIFILGVLVGVMAAGTLKSLPGVSKLPTIG